MRTAASVSSGNDRSTSLPLTTAAYAAFARPAEISAATSRTGVPDETLRVDPSGSVTVSWLIGITAGCLRVGGGAWVDKSPLINPWLANRSSCCEGCERRLVGAGGLEPLTSSVSGRRSNQLSYAPICCEIRL